MVRNFGSRSTEQRLWTVERTDLLSIGGDGGRLFAIAQDGRVLWLNPRSGKVIKEQCLLPDCSALQTNAQSIVAAIRPGVWIAMTRGRSVHVSAVIDGKTKAACADTELVTFQEKCGIDIDEVTQTLAAHLRYTGAEAGILLPGESAYWAMSQSTPPTFRRLTAGSAPDVRQGPLPPFQWKAGIRELSVPGLPPPSKIKAFHDGVYVVGSTFDRHHPSVERFGRLSTAGAFTEIPVPPQVPKQRYLDPRPYLTDSSVMYTDERGGFYFATQGQWFAYSTSGWTGPYSGTWPQEMGDYLIAQEQAPCDTKVDFAALQSEHPLFARGLPAVGKWKSQPVAAADVETTGECSILRVFSAGVLIAEVKRPIYHLNLAERYWSQLPWLQEQRTFSGFALKPESALAKAGMKFMIVGPAFLAFDGKNFVPAIDFAPEDILEPAPAPADPWSVTSTGLSWTDGEKIHLFNTAD